MSKALELTLLFNRLPGMGVSAYWKLIDIFGSIEKVFAQPASTLKPFFTEPAFHFLQQFLADSHRCELYELILGDLTWCEQHTIQVIHESSDGYPMLLRETKRAPNVLYIRGDVDILKFPQIAVVGSRNPSPLGKKAAEEFSGHLAKNGFVVTSGLALGVDTFAHQGVINVQGKTIAVMGCGIDQIYPRRNKVLAEQILLHGGAIISEFPVGTAPQSQNFPQRNRVISGLSYGTLVVEAAIKSGSLITARFAVQQNREVFAIPGSIHNPLSRGCHALIKNGATLVETGQDIVDQVQGFLQREKESMQVPLALFPEKQETLTFNEHNVLAGIGFDVTEVDLIADRTSLPINELLVLLMELELAGFITNCGAGYIRLK